jgi:hypothetical protein
MGDLSKHSSQRRVSLKSLERGKKKRKKEGMQNFSRRRLNYYTVLPNGGFMSSVKL